MITITTAATHDVFEGESIQDAINAAQVGDEIFVHAGTYYENLIVDKSLTLIGEDMENTIINGGLKNQTVIEITANNVVITGLTVKNSSRAAGTSYAGLKTSGSSCNITGNFVTQTKMGIFVTSQNNRIKENVLRNNGHGVALHSCSIATIESNNFSSNTVGISLAFSFNNIIQGNIVANSSAGGHGINLLSSSFNNTILENELTGNYHGMWLSDASSNWILNNTIKENELLGVELADSSNNTFVHNNFIDNGLPPLAPSTKHIVIRNSNCTWDNDYPSGGNFWSDYAGVDFDGDGLGDTEYIINVFNRDRYPLITPVFWKNFNPIPLVWEGIIHQIWLTSNSSISAFFFSQPEMQINFNVSETIGSIGFCNITIPKNLLSGNPWIITFNGQSVTDFTFAENITHSFLYFNYTHEGLSKTIIQGTSAISEFQIFHILTIFFAASILVFVLRRRRIC
jgi:parallel beta-helix repeat protein